MERQTHLPILMPPPPVSKQRRVSLRRPLLVAYVVAILAATLAPVPTSVWWLPTWFDKVVHAGMFLGLSLVGYWNLPGQRRQGVGGVARVVAPGAALAGAIEMVQAQMAYRTGDVWDFVWGVAGAVTGYFVARHLEGRE